MKPEYIFDAKKFALSFGITLHTSKISVQYQFV